MLGLERALGEAEVDELHLALKADHDIGGRDVAVHDPQRLLRRRAAQPMGMAERIEDRVCNHEAQPGLERHLQRRRELLEVHAVNELHREKVILTNDAGLMDGRDVGVVELGDDARLVEEAAHILLIGREVATQRLHHDEALPLTDALLGEVDVAHAAPAKDREQRIAAEGAGEAFDDAEHAPR